MPFAVFLPTSTSARSPLTTRAPAQRSQSAACVLLHDDLFTVTTSDNTITVTNNSGSDAAQVYVYYKNASGDMLLGGITYRAGVKNLAAGESQSCYTSHFVQGTSKLLFVTYAA